MDDYFKKNLTNYEPAADQWNVPNEDMWNKAQEHFPKPKKDSRLILWFFTLGIILLSSTLYFVGTTPPELYPQELNALSDVGKGEGLKKVGNETVQQKEASLSSNDPNQRPTIIADKSGSPSLSKEVRKSIKPTKANKSSQGTVTTDEVDELKVAETILFESEEVIEDKKNEIKKMPQSLASFQQKSSINQEISTKESDNSRLIRGLKINTPLPIMESTLFSKETSQENYQLKWPTLNPVYKSMKNGSYFAKHELGIGSTIHLLSFLGRMENGENEDWPEEEIFFETNNNKSLNLHYNYNFSSKWFLSSGVHYHNMNFDLDGCTFNIMTQPTIDEFIRTNLGNRLNEGFVNRNQSDNLQIELIEGESVNPGDTLKVGLDLSLTLNAIQLPVAINRKWNLKRTELFFGVGGTVDLQFWKQKSADIELFKDGRLITMPYSEGERSSQGVIAFSAFCQFGFNYKINQKYKLGLAGRIFLPELLTTGLEARVIYSL